MIEIQNLHVSSKNFELKQISFVVETHSFHTILGPTGCGKTTLLESILGLRKIKKGKILLDGKDITNLPTHQRGFSYVPQDLSLFPHLTVKENILYGLRYGNNQNKLYPSKFDDLIQSLELKHLLNRKPIHLSGGEKQRVALARALATDNPYLLLDEPFSSIHEGLKRELWFMLKTLQKKYHLTVLMISHDTQEAFFLSDNLSILIEGKIHQTDKKMMVYEYPASLEVAKYFGIKNIFSSRILESLQEYYKVFCEELNTELLIKKSQNIKKELRLGDRIRIGIRAENIMILRKDLNLKKENLISGIVESIYDMGLLSYVTFRPHHTNISVEIIMPQYAIQKLNLKPKDETTITIKSEHLFYF